MSSLFSLPQSIRTRLDTWIFESYAVTPEGLGLYRITYALFALLFFAPGHAEHASFSFLGTIPNVFFEPPPGPMEFASGFPPVLFFEGVQVLLTLSLAAVLFGYYTKTASVATTILLLVGYGFFYSLGKINHNILFVLLPAGMALSNWGAAYSIDARSGRTCRTVHSWPIVLLLLVTGFAMFTAGVPKILGGWLDPSTQAVQGRVLRQIFVHGRRDLLAPLAIQLDSPLLWEVFDVITIVFEIGFLFAVLHPLSTRLFVIGAIVFHTGVLLIMNISFLGNFIVYAAVLPWPKLARRLPSLPASLRNLSLPGWIGPVLVLGTGAFVYKFGSPFLWLNEAAHFTSDLTLADVIAVGLAWIAAAGALALESGTAGTDASPAPPAEASS